MTTTTVFGDVADGYIQSTNAVYATARSGGSLTAVDTGTDGYAGQYLAGSYVVLESFISFDTSPVPDADVISAAVLSLQGNNDFSTTDFVLEARTQNWGATLTTGDFVAGASLGALTLVASMNTTSWNAGAYNNLTSNGSNLVSAINVTGTTYILLDSDRTVAATVPTGDEYLGIDTGDASGTSLDPKLVITHAPVTVTLAGVTATATAAAGDAAMSGTIGAPYPPWPVRTIRLRR